MFSLSAYANSAYKLTITYLHNRSAKRDSIFNQYLRWKLSKGDGSGIFKRFVDDVQTAFHLQLGTGAISLALRSGRTGVGKRSRGHHHDMTYWQRVIIAKGGRREHRISTMTALRIALKSPKQNGPCAHKFKLAQCTNLREYEMISPSMRAEKPLFPSKTIWLTPVYPRCNGRPAALQRCR